MKKEEIIFDLQDKISKNNILNIKELESFEPEIDIYNEVLSPMDYNTCDRCGDLHDTNMGLNWYDYFLEQGNEYEDFLKGVEEEGEDITCVCDKCFNELVKKGEAING